MHLVADLRGCLGAGHVGVAPIGMVAGAHIYSISYKLHCSGVDRSRENLSNEVTIWNDSIREYNYVVCILCTMCVEVFIHSFKVLIHNYIDKTEFNDGVLHGTLDYCHLHEMQC